MARVVVRISRPDEAIIRHMVPFFARHFAGLATDAHSRIGEEPDLYVVPHVRVPALIRAVRAFADHENQIRKAGTQEKTAQEARFICAERPTQTFPVLEGWLLGSSFIILILFLRLRGPHRFVLCGKTALPDAGSWARFAVHIC